MTKEEQLKQIAEYLLSLDEETRVGVLEVMSGQEVAARGGGCSNALKPNPDQGTTPYGQFVCINGKWVWVPELG